MKANLLFSIMMSGLCSLGWSQDRTTVNATNSEISDNLDLRAVASIFGDSRDLEDFERRLNDPKTPISNLDLNQDNQVDYLRVVESIEGNQHIIVLQAILGRDQYQDVATVEVEKDPRTNRVQVQVVGDVYMYGSNYIYEPVYVNTPVIYSYFWTPYYRPYCSTWYWGYYPSYYYAWNPFPIFRYRHHIGLCINFNYYYNYVSYRRCQVAYNHYYGRRCNYFERRYPDRSFTVRNQGITNRYELDRSRPSRNVAYPDTRDALAGTRDNSSTRGNSGIRNANYEPTRSTGGIRGNWTSASEPRPVRDITTTSSNPRPTKADFSSSTVSSTPRPTRSNYITSSGVSQQYVNPVRSNNYDGNIRSNTGTSYEVPRPTRSESVSPKPSTSYIPSSSAGGRQYNSSSTSSGGGRQYQSSSSQGSGQQYNQSTTPSRGGRQFSSSAAPGGRSTGNTPSLSSGNQGRSGSEGRR